MLESYWISVLWVINDHVKLYGSALTHFYLLANIRAILTERKLTAKIKITWNLVISTFKYDDGPHSWSFRQLIFNYFNLHQNSACHRQDSSYRDSIFGIACWAACEKTNNCFFSRGHLIPFSYCNFPKKNPNLLCNQTAQDIIFALARY